MVYGLGIIFSVLGMFLGTSFSGVWTNFVRHLVLELFVVFQE